VLNQDPSGCQYISLHTDAFPLLLLLLLPPDVGDAGNGGPILMCDVTFARIKEELHPLGRWMPAVSTTAAAGPAHPACATCCALGLFGAGGERAENVTACYNMLLHRLRHTSDFVIDSLSTLTQVATDRHVLL